jgi:hypothetical protein
MRTVKGIKKRKKFKDFNQFSSYNKFYNNRLSPMVLTNNLLYSNNEMYNVHSKMCTQLFSPI